MFQAINRCKSEVESIQRVAGPAGALLGLCGLALVVGGVIAGLGG